MFRYLLLTASLALSPAHADPVTVAVASNFAGPARELAERFEAETGHELRLATGSTGKLYAQILAGAPFDVFLSADEAAPAKLLERRLATQALPYALGRLLVVSADPALAGRPCVNALRDADGATVALANPRAAPYGVAADKLLARWEIGTTYKRVYAENVAQAMHFVASGNAEFGLVGVAQFHAVKDGWPGCASFPDPDSEGTAAIPQAAALLSRGQGRAEVDAFFAFLFTAAARAVIAGWDYGVPDHGVPDYAVPDQEGPDHEIPLGRPPGGAPGDT